MNNQDPIADMLTRIRNANRVGRRMVLIPKSKICSGIAAVLKEEGYIEQFDEIPDTQQGQLRVKLKYGMNGDKVIHVIDRASKPGCRVYRGVDELPQVLLGQHDHRLVSEVLMEVLGRLVLRGPLADQGVGPSARMQARRGEDPRAGEHDDRRDHEPGPAHGDSSDPLEESSPRVHQAEVRERI